MNEEAAALIVKIHLLEEEEAMSAVYSTVVDWITERKYEEVQKFVSHAVEGDLSKNMLSYILDMVKPYPFCSPQKH